MAIMFEEEAKIAENNTRKNFMFVGFPYRSPISLDDYRMVLEEIEKEYPIKIWYFLVELTTDELMRKLWRAILRSDICVFDTSGGNPNVSFEVGLAVARFKKCSTILKTGSENPLGNADLAYAERIEYSSSITLKQALVKIIRSKSSAMNEIQKAVEFIYDPSSKIAKVEIETKLLKILNAVFDAGKITKTQAEKLIEDREFADYAMNHLRDRRILKVDGVKKGAKWMLEDDWVYRNHQVVGIG